MTPVRRVLGLLVPQVAALTAGAATQNAGCPRWRDAFAGMPTLTVTVESAKRTVALRVEVAETPDKKVAGFQEITTCVRISPVP